MSVLGEVAQVLGGSWGWDGGGIGSVGRGNTFVGFLIVDIGGAILGVGGGDSVDWSGVGGVVDIGIGTWAG